MDSVLKKLAGLILILISVALLFSVGNSFRLYVEYVMEYGDQMSTRTWIAMVTIGIFGVAMILTLAEKAFGLAYKWIRA